MREYYPWRVELGRQARSVAVREEASPSAGTMTYQTDQVWQSVTRHPCRHELAQFRFDDGLLEYEGRIAETPC